MSGRNRRLVFGPGPGWRAEANARCAARVPAVANGCFTTARGTQYSQRRPRAVVPL